MDYNPQNSTFCDNCTEILIKCFVCLPKDSQQWLGRLIPDKQCLNEQLKQVQQNSLHSKYCFLSSAHLSTETVSQIPGQK